MAAQRYHGRMRRPSINSIAKIAKKRAGKIERTWKFFLTGKVHRAP
jgi:hypothetical protein